jgi:hypothetical protein
MTDRMSFEERLEAAYERYLQGAPRSVDPYLVARAAIVAGPHGPVARLGRLFDTPALRLATAVVVLLLALAAAVLVGSALQREPRLPIVQGEFTRVGPPTQDGRRQAIPLLDGRVLLVGVSQPPNTNTEVGVVHVFDPATNDVSRLEDRPVVRSWAGQGLVRLADGRVLVTGGQEIASDGSFERPAPTEVIDPVSGSIATVGPMVHSRYGHTATLLSDGRVLIVGGDVSIGPNPASNASTELFDPSTGSFSETGSLNHARMYHRATLLADGRVLITGGVEAGSNTLAAELFDPANESFTSVGSLHAGRTDHSATLLADGRVLVAGGNGLDAAGFVADDAIATAEVFDPQTGQFTDSSPLTTERSQHAALLLEDGRVLIAGGFNFDGEPRTSELFDPATGTFERGASTLDPLGSTTAAALPDGQVLVVGESDPLELFDPSASGPIAPTPAPRNDLAGAVTAASPPAIARFGHTATRLPDGRVLVAGGTEDPWLPFVAPGVFDSAELYDPRTGSWSPTGALNQARMYHTATLLHDGRVLITGGQVPVPGSDGGTTLESIDSAELYDPVTGAFTQAGRMTVARGATDRCCGQLRRHTGTVLEDGRVVLAGGADRDGLDVFDPGTNQFTGVRGGCQGEPIVLEDGRILFGCAAGNVFDPATNTVDAAPDRAWLRSIGTLLPDGRLLITDAAGNGPVVVDATVNAGEMSWWTVETLLDQRVGGASVQSVTALPDGRLLVFARRLGDVHPLDLAYAGVFDPRLATFTEVRSPAGRYASTATLLPDGRILFVGIPNRSPDRTDAVPPVAELLDLGLQP